MIYSQRVTLSQITCASIQSLGVKTSYIMLTTWQSIYPWTNTRNGRIEIPPCVKPGSHVHVSGSLSGCSCISIKNKK